MAQSNFGDDYRMVIPPRTMWVESLNYGLLAEHEPYCEVKYGAMPEDNTSQFHEKECFYCGKEIVSIHMDHRVDLHGTEAHWLVEVKYGCWCAMWLFKAREKQIEWDTIKPEFNKWVEEQDVPWVKLTT